MDLGLKLPIINQAERMETSGPFGTRCTQRMHVESVLQIDDDLLA